MTYNPDINDILNLDLPWLTIPTVQMYKLSQFPQEYLIYLDKTTPMHELDITLPRFLNTMNDSTTRLDAIQKKLTDIYNIGTLSQGNPSNETSFILFDRGITINWNYYPSPHTKSVFELNLQIASKFTNQAKDTITNIQKTIPHFIEKNLDFTTPGNYIYHQITQTDKFDTVLEKGIALGNDIAIVESSVKSMHDTLIKNPYICRVSGFRNHFIDSNSIDINSIDLFHICQDYLINSNLEVLLPLVSILGTICIVFLQLK